MQISKFIPTLCLAGLCASGPALQAADNPAQAAARLALAQKLFEQSAQQPETNPPVATTPSKPKAVKAAHAEKPKASKAAQPAPAVVVTSAPLNTNTDNPAQAAARQALAQKLFELDAKQPSSQAAAQPAPAAKPAPKKIAKTEKVLIQTPAKVSTAKPAAGEAKPAAVPVAPVVETKADKLKALLKQYKTDQISPAEYHQQRAALMTQP